MKIDFVSAADAAVVAVPVAKDALGATRWDGALAGARRVAEAAAGAARFTGEAGTIAEAPVERGDGFVRLLLLGVGAGTAADWEKAGGALTARLLTGGATEVAVELPALAERPDAATIARFAGAAAQRGIHTF